jgi:hypothetical protein
MNPSARIRSCGGGGAFRRVQLGGRWFLSPDLCARYHAPGLTCLLQASRGQAVATTNSAGAKRTLPADESRKNRVILILMKRQLIAAALVLSIGGSAVCDMADSASASAPSGWKSVTHRGVGIDVPSTWAVRQTVKAWQVACGSNTPTIYVGPERRAAAPSCVAGPYNHGSSVVLGSLTTYPRSGWHAKKLNGLNALVRTSTRFVTFPHSDTSRRKGGELTDIVVRLPTKGMSIDIRVGDSSVFPGGAPGRARQIMETIHSVGS